MPFFREILFTATRSVALRLMERISGDADATWARTRDEPQLISSTEHNMLVGLSRVSKAATRTRRQVWSEPATRMTPWELSKLINITAQYIKAS